MSGYCFNIEITAYMIHKLHLRNTDLLVFAILDYYTKKNGFCTHQPKLLADMLGMNVTTVYKCIRNLHAINHYIEIEKVITSDGKTLMKIRTIV